MDYHMAVGTEFAYEPDFISCGLTFYSDASIKKANGLLVCRVHFDPNSVKLHWGLSCNDLSTYYLQDLINLLNSADEGFKEISIKHKKMTCDVNLIDYDELRHACEFVNDLYKISTRLQIIGCSAFSILHDSRKLNSGVCIGGYVSNTDNLCVPTANFFDSKVTCFEDIADFLMTGAQQQSLSQDFKSRLYALSGSSIYLVIYTRENVFDYIVLLSEEPIANLIHVIKSREHVDGFDFIYTIVGHTLTEEESCPYVTTPQTCFFKDVVLYCNENRFSFPVLSTIEDFQNYLEQTQTQTVEVDEEDDSKPCDENTFEMLKLFAKSSPNSRDKVNALLFEILIKYRDDVSTLYQKLSELSTMSWEFDSRCIEDFCQDPMYAAFKTAEEFIHTNINNLDQMLLDEFLKTWLEFSKDDRIQTLIDFVQQYTQEQLKLISSVNKEPQMEDDMCGLYDEAEYEWG